MAKPFKTLNSICYTKLLHKVTDGVEKWNLKESPQLTLYATLILTVLEWLFPPSYWKLCEGLMWADMKGVDFHKKHLVGEYMDEDNFPAVEINEAYI